jgi:multiple sugar transport system ATP-binding protein
MEDASLVTDTPPDRRLATTCDLTEPLGAEVLVYFTVAARALVPDVTGDDSADADVYFGEPKTADSEPSSRLVARVSPRTRISEGDPIELAVDTSRLYFFDPETGAAVS